MFANVEYKSIDYTQKYGWCEALSKENMILMNDNRDYSYDNTINE